MKTKRPQSTAAIATSVVPLGLKVKRILVPIDFSAHSEHALSVAVSVAEQFGAEIILVNVLEQFIYPGDVSFMPMTLPSYVSEREEANASRLKAMLEGSKIKHHSVVRVGRAWDEIVQVSKKLKTDLIVIATHGHTGLRHALLGSVAERVVQHAPCAVLTVRPDNCAAKS